MALDLKVGDVVRMKKPHPCGNHLWLVTRLGTAGTHQPLVQRVF